MATKLTYLRVEDNVHTTIIRRATKDKWDCDDVDKIHSLQWLEIVDEEKFHDLVVNFPLTENDTLYVVYGLYRTGCSFCTTNGEIIFVNAYKTASVARKVQRALEAHHKQYQDIEKKTRYSYSNKLSASEKKFNEHQVAVLMPDEVTQHMFYVPWHGYFERLEGIYVAPLMVVDGRENS